MHWPPPHRPRRHKQAALAGVWRIPTQVPIPDELRFIPPPPGLLWHSRLSSAHPVFIESLQPRQGSRDTWAVIPPASCFKSGGIERKNPHNHSSTGDGVMSVSQFLNDQLKKLEVTRGSSLLSKPHNLSYSSCHLCGELWFQSCLSLSFLNFYWCMVVLQCYVSLWCTAKWISYMCVHYKSPLFLDFLPIQVTTEYWVDFPVLIRQSVLN